MKYKNRSSRSWSSRIAQSLPWAQKRRQRETLLAEKQILLEEKEKALQENESLMLEKEELIAEIARLNTELEAAPVVSASTEQITKAIEDAVHLELHIKDILSTILTNEVLKLVHSVLGVLVKKIETAAQVMAKSQKSIAASSSVSKGETRKRLGAEKSLIISEPIAQQPKHLCMLTKPLPLPLPTNRLRREGPLRRVETKELPREQKSLQLKALKPLPFKAFRLLQPLKPLQSSKFKPLLINPLMIRISKQEK